MKAYHGKIEIKNKYLARVRAHREADELIQGQYWQKGKGCAVGCTIHGADHGWYEIELGIPRMLARLEDGIFEGLPNKRALLWPEEFLGAITPGADLSQVGDRFLHWLLMDAEEGVIRFAETEAQKKAISRVGELYEKKIAGETIDIEAWSRARSECWAATTAATTTAAITYATTAAAYAAYATYAAAAITYATYAATYAAARRKREKTRARQAEKLIELLRAAPMETLCR